MHMTLCSENWHLLHVNPPSQTTGIPEITPSPHFSPSSILQGTQTLVWVIPCQINTKKILTPTDLNENWFLHSVS